MSRGVMFTIVVKMPSGDFYVGKSSTTEGFMRLCQDKFRAGFFHQKRNLGRAQIVFCVKGDFVRNIRSFGIGRFMSLINSYEPVTDRIVQLLT